ncbi:hypothetical protein CC1G_08768 [Coprinopsis cinerea okayama7|uniref:Uncharacterized protein n=1 Tax=Coprinopsis cinerea (strain Okayama-7 / 130 / ATCC MYA-4618 / FGSC 9003) TaxID=240176 RepID=A8NJ33_COPC7|nr:hypothetical protein CC1G_08768 [Coprinopsis cinerea okayama7\|eukprot:XP_001834137.2 hypothetical protein CC1G_08768 [Coprinopsis cinerea okayama7\
MAEYVRDKSQNIATSMFVLSITAIKLREVSLVISDIPEPASPSSHLTSLRHMARFIERASAAAEAFTRACRNLLRTDTSDVPSVTADRFESQMERGIGTHNGATAGNPTVYSASLGTDSTASTRVAPPRGIHITSYYLRRITRPLWLTASASIASFVGYQQGAHPPYLEWRSGSPPPVNHQGTSHNSTSWVHLYSMLERIRQQVRAQIPMLGVPAFVTTVPERLFTFEDSGEDNERPRRLGWLTGNWRAGWIAVGSAVFLSLFVVLGLEINGRMKAMVAEHGGK